MALLMSGISSNDKEVTTELAGRQKLLESITLPRQEDYEKLFQKLDISNNGEITIQEFTKALDKMDHPIKDNKGLMNKVFESLDTNKDRKIDYADFKRYLTTTDEQILKGFKVIDRDNDGKLSKQDFFKYLTEILRLSPSDKNIELIFNQIDTKHDGYITFDEFRNFLLLVPRIGGSRIRTAFQYMVEELDISSDGDVTVINQFLNGFGYFLAGGISGVVSRTCTAPFDRIKVFLIARTDLKSTVLNSRKSIEANIQQHVAEEMSKMTHPKTIRSPIIQAARTIWKQGGFKGFYVGNGLNIMKVFPESAMKFGTFELTKRMLARVEGVEDTKDLSKSSTYLAGGLGGMVAQFAVYPIDTLKFRLQCSNIDAQKKGEALLLKTAKELYKEGGFRIFYRGIVVGVGGIFPYAALDLGTFTTIKKWLVKRQMTKYNIKNEEDVKLPNYMVMTLGALSGSFGATVVYPINLLRTRLQAQGTFAHPYRYHGFMDVLHKTIRNEGVPGLFKGLVPNLAKVAPAMSISYFMYENLKNLFDLETNK